MVTWEDTRVDGFRQWWCIQPTWFYRGVMLLWNWWWNAMLLGLFPGLFHCCSYYCGCLAPSSCSDKRLAVELYVSIFSSRQASTEFCMCFQLSSFGSSDEYDALRCLLPAFPDTTRGKRMPAAAAWPPSLFFDSPHHRHPNAPRRGNLSCVFVCWSLTPVNAACYVHGGPRG
jgi:hypothetical protein